MPEAISDLEQVLENTTLPIIELVRGGGGEGALTQRIRRALADDYGWRKHCFEIKKTIDGEEKECIPHEADHVRRFNSGGFALEIE